MVDQKGRVFGEIRTWPQQREHEARHGFKVGRKEWIEAIASLGLSAAFCARRFDCNGRTLLRLANQYGFGFKSVEKVSDERLRDYVQAGLTAREVAQRLDVHVSTVHSRARRLGLLFASKPRTKHQCSKASRIETLADLRVSMPDASVLKLMAEMAQRESLAMRAAAGRDVR